jgi:hypothetical protein
MPTDWDTPLTPEEFSALQEVGMGLMQTMINEECRGKLTHLGLIKQGLDGVILTDAGKIRVASGN